MVFSVRLRNGIGQVIMQSDIWYRAVAVTDSCRVKGQVIRIYGQENTMVPSCAAEAISVLEGISIRRSLPI
jgi:hypothetical protein